MFYSGGAEDQIEAFMEKNPTYLWYNPIFNTNYNKEKKDDKKHHGTRSLMKTRIWTMPRHLPKP
jgi:hypothetical protein